MYPCTLHTAFSSTRYWAFPIQFNSYSVHESSHLAFCCRRWCKKNKSNKMKLTVLCGVIENAFSHIYIYTHIHFPFHNVYIIFVWHFICVYFFPGEGFKGEWFRCQIRKFLWAGCVHFKNWYSNILAVPNQICVFFDLKTQIYSQK